MPVAVPQKETRFAPIAFNNLNLGGDDGTDEERVDMHPRQETTVERVVSGNQVARDFAVYTTWAVILVCILFAIPVCLRPDIAAGVALAFVLLLLKTRGTVSEISESTATAKAFWKLGATIAAVLLASSAACGVSKLHPEAWREFFIHGTNSTL